MKFCFYNIYYLFLIVFENIFVSEVNAWRCDYTYVKKVKGYFKYHDIPANWRDARLRCYDEGAVLASPHPEEIYDTLLDLMKDRNRETPIFTGIQARISKGDYRTLDGIPLSKIPLKWSSYEPDNYKDSENCLILTSDGHAADKNCLDTYPYYCYKEKKEYDNISQDICSVTDYAYEYSEVTHSCYKFHTVPRTWSRANMGCFSEGGHLLIINSKEEADVIVKLFSKNPVTKIIGQYRKDIAFLGIHDQDEEGDWRTVNDETLEDSGYANFSHGQPNNLNKAQHCGCVFRTGSLCDYGCNEPLPFICEKKPISPTCMNYDNTNQN